MSGPCTSTLEPLAAAARSAELRLVALPGLPLVRQGDDLVRLILEAVGRSGERLRDGDVLVIAQKIVSKTEGRAVRIDSVVPSARAVQLATETGRDPRIVELILAESEEVLRASRDVIVVVHRLGFVMANAGIDQSNVAQGDGAGIALLLPRDPDATCMALREALRRRTGADLGIIINDSHGRPFRTGTVGVALGVAGLPGLLDLRGRPDLFDRRLQSTEIGYADEIASAASLLMGQADEGRPVVLVRGVPLAQRDGDARELIRPRSRDLFR
jgi:coenzyme F420-0:L-glutamate ligase/coenzyme F420-1:gamma-L-glutamate ligase